MKIKLSQLRNIVQEVFSQLHEDVDAPKDTEWPDIQQMAKMHPDKLMHLSKIAPNRFYGKTASLLANAFYEKAKGNQRMMLQFIEKAKEAWLNFQETEEDQTKRAARDIKKYKEIGGSDYDSTKQGHTSGRMTDNDVRYSNGRLRGTSPIKGNW